MRALVTGGAGFVGTNLIKKLLKKMEILEQVIIQHHLQKTMIF